jgi:nucleoside recognition membrane protein YjiH
MSVRVDGVVLHSRSSCQLFRFLLFLLDLIQARSWDSDTYRGIIACLVVSRVVAIRLRDEHVLAMKGPIVVDDVTYTINGVQKSIEQARILHLIQMVVLIVNLIDGNVLWVYDGISHLCI